MTTSKDKETVPGLRFFSPDGKEIGFVPICSTVDHQMGVPTDFALSNDDGVLIVGKIKPPEEV